MKKLKEFLGYKKNKPFMQEFHWRGIESSGREVSGTLACSSYKMVRAYLLSQDIKIQKIHLNKLKLLRRKKISSKHITVFTRQLASMVKAGIPLKIMLDMLSKEYSQPNMKPLLNNIIAQIEAGSSLAESLAHYPQYFNSYYTTLISLGEASGSLTTVLETLASHREKTEYFQRTIRQSLYYPIFVLFFSILLSIGFAVHIIPVFKDLFEQFNGQLPFLTQIIIDVAALLDNYWMAGLAGLIVLIVFFVSCKRNLHSFNLFLDKLFLKLPVIGPLLEKTIMGHIFRALALCFSTGLSLLKSLDSIEQLISNKVYQHGIQNIRQDLCLGYSLTQSLQRAQLFPLPMTQLVAIGEEAGTLDKMLDKIADYYEEEAHHRLTTCSRLLEPFIISILGILVGGLVLSMYLPIFQFGAMVY